MVFTQSMDASFIRFPAHLACRSTYGRRWEGRKSDTLRWRKKPSPSAGVRDLCRKRDKASVACSNRPSLCQPIPHTGVLLQTPMEPGPAPRAPKLLPNPQSERPRASVRYTLRSLPNGLVESDHGTAQREGGRLSRPADDRTRRQAAALQYLRAAFYL